VAMMTMNAQTSAAILACLHRRIRTITVLPPVVPEKLTLSAGMVPVC